MPEFLNKSIDQKKKKKKEKKERKRRDSGEQGSGRRPQRRALASRRSLQTALGPRHFQVAQPSDPAAGRALPAGGDLRDYGTSSSVHAAHCTRGVLGEQNGSDLPCVCS